MNKKLVVLPLLGLLTCGLFACNGGQEEFEDIDPEEGEEITLPTEPETFGGYRRVVHPEAGKDYLLGMLQPKLSKMIFMNGAPHRDVDQDNVPTDYPFYFACNQYDYDENDPTVSAGVDAGFEATKVQVFYDDPSDAENFRIGIVRGTGKEQYYDDKDGEEMTYIQVYGDKNGTKVHTSIKCDKTLDPTNGAWYFKYYEKFTYRTEEYPVDGYGLMFKNPKGGDGLKAELVALGTHDEYPNVEAESAQYIPSSFMAHFWEKIAD